MFVAYYVIVFLFTFWAVSTHAATRGKPGVALMSAIVMPFTLPLIPVIGLLYWVVGKNRTPNVKSRILRALPAYPNAAELIERQKDICGKNDSRFDPPSPDDPAAVAYGTLDSLHLYMARQSLEDARYGWVIYGHLSSPLPPPDISEFTLTAVAEIEKRLPQLAPYLALDEYHTVYINEKRSIVREDSRVLLGALTRN